MSTLSYALFDTFLCGSVKITSPYKGHLKEVKVLVDFHNGAGTILSGTMRYVRCDEIEHPIFGQFDDESSPIVPHHLQARLQESR